jgi:hypothetical protein
MNDMFRYVHFSFLPFFDRTLTCFSFFSMYYFCLELEGYMLIQILMCARRFELFRTSSCSINIDKFFFCSFCPQPDILTLEKSGQLDKKKKMVGSDTVCIVCLNNILFLALCQMNMYDGESTHHYQHRSHLR